MKAEKFTTIFFLSVIVIFMCLVPVSLAVKQVNKRIEAEKNRNTFKSSIHWAKLYPFDEYDTKHDQVHQGSFNPEKLFSYVKAKIDEYSSNYLIVSMQAIEAAKTYEDAIGWNIASAYEYNGVTKLYDGYLTGITASRDVVPNAEAVIDFAGYCRDKGIEFFYVNAPCKVCVSEDKNISGILDFSNQNADRFLGLLGNAGIKTYDLRKILHLEGMNHHEAFFRTDHHWKPETGLWAAKHILEFLRDDYGWDIDPEILASERFKYVIYPEWFLGSQGKKVTHTRTKPDDFTMIYPAFTTNIHYEIPSIGLNTSGDFTVTYNMREIEPKDYYNKNMFSAYNHGRSPLTRLENISAKNNRKIMLIYDSFSNAVIPFLALAIKNVSSIDLRQFTGSLKKYIDMNTPDLIMVVYNSDFPGQTISLNTHTGMYDFR